MILILMNPYTADLCHITITQRIMEAVLKKLESCQATMEQILEKISAIEKFIYARQDYQSPNTDEVWLDKDTVCAYLKISNRTLQRYRSKKTLSYVMVGKKSYYTVSEIKRLLREKCVPRSDESLRELSGKGLMNLPKD